MNNFDNHFKMWEIKFIKWNDHLWQQDLESNIEAPDAIDDQIKKAATLIKRMDLKEYSALQFPNPGKLPYNTS